MRIALLSILLIFTILPGFAQVNDKAQSLISLHKQKFGWFIEKKTDSLKLLLDDNVIYIHSAGLMEGKTEVIESIQSGKVVYQKIDVEEAKARFYGETGIITGVARFVGINNGKPFDLSITYTEVYFRVKKQWKLVSRHASTPPVEP